MHPAPGWYYSDNGFPSVEEMHEAHQPIVALATAVLSDTGGNLVDLGCGNGMLLKKIHEAQPASVPFGIDVAPSRIEHARELNPHFAAHFVSGEMFESDQIWPAGRRYALAILMPGRMVEAGPDRAEKLRRRLQEQCDQVLVYAYDDWLARYNTLSDLAGAVGISIMSSADTAVVGLVTGW